ncbi:MAG: hypothetical protein QG629_347 [Patescibacteria group bacterium]|nr:excalibur calcium-binding domain-containing protein [Candidatus Saccharibacteria bacterium]MDQ5963265.1 hypothetical protein [Patescibacteria group bacterium]
MSEHKRNKTALANAKSPSKPSAQTARDEEIQIAIERDRNARGGFLLDGAVWLLSRFPLTRDRYQNWTRTKRIIIGWLLWLILLPIIPIAIAIIWFVRDPEGFKKSPWAKALIVLCLAWGGYFGAVATNPSQADVNGRYSPVQTAPNGEVAGKQDSLNTASEESKQKVAKQTESKDSQGRKFKNCTEAFEVGVFDIKRPNASYERKLDRDNDGIACEK